ncbi:hypothetical protein F4859DRAFT_510574 [Xylaria cf. heliscus]|nr:hypothetical protein F4859DRAFT_510574 [Xylaria cf. heliscus]
MSPTNTHDQHTESSANTPDLLDRHEEIMAAILTRFRNMVAAATEPLPAAAAIPQAALSNIIMNNEAAALINEVQNLVALNREIKQLWITGPLRKPGDADEKNVEKVIDERAARVSKLYNTLVELENEDAKKSAAQQPPDGPRVNVKNENGETSVKQEHQGDSA